MPAPTPPTQPYSFTGWQQSAGIQFPGPQLDVQTQLLIASIQSVIASLALIQRSDGALANQSVGVDQAAPDLIALLGTVGFNPRGAWQTATAYAAKDLVKGTDGYTYVCVTAHASGDFATDLGNNLWLALTGPNVTPPAPVQQVPAGTRSTWAADPAHVPSGWLIENGAAVSRTVYAALFGVIGTSFGAGDGATTFNLPNTPTTTQQTVTVYGMIKI